MIEGDAASAFMASLPYLGGLVIGIGATFVGVRFLIDWLREAERAS